MRVAHAPLIAPYALDCFAEPVIGRVRANRWLAMTGPLQPFTSSNSTSNISVAFGGITPPAPRAP